MNNDRYEFLQTRSNEPQHSSQDIPRQDTPPGTSSFQKEDWISEEDLVQSVAFSLENLRSKYPEPNAMVSAMWGWLSSELAHITVGPDRTVACLAMLDEIIRLGGFEISDNAREYFNDHFLTPYVIRRLEAVRAETTSKC